MIRTVARYLALYAVLVAIGAYAFWGCAGASPRHIATGTSTAVYDALSGVQAASDAAVTAGSMSAATRQAEAVHLLPALQAGRDLNTAILNWAPGAPVPANIKTLAANLSALITDVASASTNPATQAKIALGIASANAALTLLLAGQ